MKKYNIALFYGGYTGESVVSEGSAKMVAKHLDNTKFNVYPIELQRNKWVYHFNEKEYKYSLDTHTLKLEDKEISFDCAFIAIHGTPGEDGKLQGYLDMAAIPYTSCNVDISSLTFNKYFCNLLAEQFNANVAKTTLLQKGDNIDIESITKEYNFPFFIKPNRSGSSLGVSKVKNIDDILPSIEKAFAEDDEILIQKAINGREIACGVYKIGNNIKALPLTEIISNNDFFDFEAKYEKGKSQEITPANISEELTKECQDLSVELYKKFNCNGVVRFDYFLDEKKWWFLEVNTIPGFSEASIVPQQVVAANIDLTDFFSSLVLDCLKK